MMGVPLCWLKQVFFSCREASEKSRGNAEVLRSLGNAGDGHCGRGGGALEKHCWNVGPVEGH